MQKPIVAGNWKMHGTIDTALALADAVARSAPRGVETVIFPAAIHVAGLAARCKDALAIGAQDVSEHATEGARTGEISAAMLRDAGCTFTLVGHSERRRHHGETDARVAAKHAAAIAAGLTPVTCVGETLEERQSGRTEQVIARQLNAISDVCGNDAFHHAVIAYEPVWAIGTGQAATFAQIRSVHAFIRHHVTSASGDDPPILYGGGITPDNAAELFALENVNGGLVGGASLNAGDFLRICRAAL